MTAEPQPYHTPHSARSAGYSSMTIPYSLPNEQWMLDRAKRDAEKAGVEVVAVTVADGVELWKRDRA